MRLLDGLSAPCRVGADFNECRGDAMWASLRRADPVGAGLAAGDLVDLYDDDGMSCWGRVTKRRGSIIEVRMLWDSLRDPVIFTPVLPAPPVPGSSDRTEG